MDKFCAEEGFYFEPLLTFLAHFNKFMNMYQSAAAQELDSS